MLDCPDNILEWPEQLTTSKTLAQLLRLVEGNSFWFNVMTKTFSFSNKITQHCAQHLLARSVTLHGKNIQLFYFYPWSDSQCWSSVFLDLLYDEMHNNWSVCPAFRGVGVIRGMWLWVFLFHNNLSLCRVSPLIPSLTQQPCRTLTYFSVKKGKRKTVRAVVQRFLRLHCGLWVRRKVRQEATGWFVNNYIHCIFTLLYLYLTGESLQKNLILNGSYQWDLVSFSDAELLFFRYSSTY